MYYDTRLAHDASGTSIRWAANFGSDRATPKPVEDFLARDHVGTTAITLDAKASRHQHDVAAAADADAALKPTAP